ncbi:DUF6958 family protein [Piscibacillus salipiscarius]|uniref:DUF6958 family protein n=1 Tax=Piscibacillus salipiscarius TaxID=299480 RepID=A0ABW5QCN0_9BACI|nr:hypothetical protein [Piscibacillus salipiscarius]
MGNRIKLQHPNSDKHMQSIDKEKYNQIKDVILSVIEKHEGITFKELSKEVLTAVKDSFDGSPSWYCTAVKLDLEARGLIKRIDSKSPQRLKINR